MALLTQIKSSGQMDPVEIQKAEERYQLFMEGQKERIPGLCIHIGVDIGTGFSSAIKALKDLHGKMMIISAGGIQSGKTSMAIHMASLMAGRPVMIRREMDDEMIKRKLEAFHGFHAPMFNGLHDVFEQLKETSSMAIKEFRSFNEQVEKIKQLEEYDDEPLNFCHGEQPPTQKKFRSHVPDKRVINRRNRKSKRK